MNYKEAVAKRIIEQSDELERRLDERKQLWDDIVNAYEKGGEDAIKSVLIERSKRITEAFSRLLIQLEGKL